MKGPEHDLVRRLATPGRSVLAGLPEGLDGLVLGDVVRLCAPRPLLHIARDDQRLNHLEAALAFFAPDIEVIRFPAWDCLPYDRVSPAADILAQRMSALTRLAHRQDGEGPCLVLATVNAALQRVPPREAVEKAHFSARPGNRVSMDALQVFLTHNGYSRTGTVVDRGDYAVRGGIIDIYPPGNGAPVRLDFFGDTLESIRSFDVETQRTTGQMPALTLDAASEVLLTESSIARFRTGYAAAFGGPGHTDPLYEAVSAGRRYQGMEHWLALFHDHLETLFAYLPEAAVSHDHLADEAVERPSRSHRRLLRRPPGGTR